jgi:hypothetical protein
MHAEVVEIEAHAGRWDEVAIVHLVKEIGNAARSWAHVGSFDNGRW